MDAKKRKKTSVKVVSKKQRKNSKVALNVSKKLKKMKQVRSSSRRTLVPLEPIPPGGAANRKGILNSSSTTGSRPGGGKSTIVQKLKPVRSHKKKVIPTPSSSQKRGKTSLRRVKEIESTPRPLPPPPPPPPSSVKKVKKPHNVGRPKPKKKSPRMDESQSSISPLPTNLNPLHVEFEFDGHTEMFGITQPLTIMDTTLDGFTEPPTPFSFIQEDSRDSPIFPSSPSTSASHKKGGRGVGKGKGKHKRGLKSNGRKSLLTGGSASQQRLLAEALAAAEAEGSGPFKLPEAVFRILPDYKPIEAPPRPNNAYIRYIERPQEEMENDVEYDLDEQDLSWLEFTNKIRREGSLPLVKPEIMELLMDKLEKESYFQMQSSGYEHRPLIDDDAICCICMDGECQNSNAILFCDMCNLPVHQECYGVPYIPEGQWLCRRCLQSPSRAVDCVLCPNKGNAFKQTDDGRWAHVVCAIWIPEVCFANTVFLEPVDNINNIPTARWKLTCYICKQKGVGACIQCHKTNCYTAFHVTCAQQAGLYMKMDTVRESQSYIVKKIAYCDNHAPVEQDSPASRQRMRMARKILAEKRSEVPSISIPTIPVQRINEIVAIVNFPKKLLFVERLMAYWKLKRQSRNGVPLLRRLQSANPFPHHPAGVGDEKKSKASNIRESRAYFYKLRCDLEKARLLCELVRKREKMKREQVHLKCRVMTLKIEPMIFFFNNVLDEIASHDSQGIFADPVNPEEVPDYLDVVQSPMDLSTMREKVNSLEYDSLESIESDFNLMIENCLRYNSRDTVFYRTAIKIKEYGGIVLRQAKREWVYNGFDPRTGLHSEEGVPPRPKPLSDDQIIDKVEDGLESEERHSLPYPQHVNYLHELMDTSLGIKNTGVRKRKFEKVRNELQRIKIRNKSPRMSTTMNGAKNNINDPKKNGSEAGEAKDIYDSFLRRLSKPVTPQRNQEVEVEDEEEAEESNMRVLRPHKKRPTDEKISQKVKEANRKKRELKLARSKSGRFIKMNNSTPNGPISESSGVLSSSRQKVKVNTAAGAAQEDIPGLEHLSKEEQARLMKEVAGVDDEIAWPWPIGSFAKKSTPPAEEDSLGKDDGGSKKKGGSGGGPLAVAPNQSREKKKRKRRKSSTKESGHKQNGGLVKSNSSNSIGNDLGSLNSSPPSKKADSFTVYRSSGGNDGVGSDDELEDSRRNEDSSSEPEGEGVRGPLEEIQSSTITNSSGSETGKSSPYSDHEELMEVEEEGIPNSVEVEKELQVPKEVVEVEKKVEEAPKKYKNPTRILKLKKKKKKKHLNNSHIPHGEKGGGGGGGGREDEKEDGLVMDLEQVRAGMLQIALKPQDLVWAQSGEGSWYPALIINPEESGGTTQNGVNIPGPPIDIQSRPKSSEPVFLVLFFDSKRTWEWIERRKLIPLGHNPESDKQQLDVKKGPEKKAVRRAYERAILHRNAVAGGGGGGIDNNSNSLIYSE